MLQRGMFEVNAQSENKSMMHFIMLNLRFNAHAVNVVMHQLMITLRMYVKYMITLVVMPKTARTLPTVPVILSLFSVTTAVAQMQGWLQAAPRQSAVRPRREPQPQHHLRTHQSSATPALAGGVVAVATIPRADADLLTCTSRLALSTARQMRTLSGMAVRTLTLPDTSPLAQPLAVVAHMEKPWSENMLCYTWGHLITVLLAHPDNLPPEALLILQTHAQSQLTPDALREHILECHVARTWDGSSTIIKFATSTELKEVSAAIILLLTSSGARLRFGAPPRGPLERATASALDCYLHPQNQHG